MEKNQSFSRSFKQYNEATKSNETSCKFFFIILIYFYLLFYDNIVFVNNLFEKTIFLKLCVATCSPSCSNGGVCRGGVCDCSEIDWEGV
jgi:hypothetical protein